MDIFAVLTMLGGLALFMYGMTLMGESLERASDGQLERMLKKLTSSKLRGVLLGTGITAIIQSSSATTVTLVGFVNSGVMKLSQATPVVLGANIGTTATAWLLSLAGIEGNNVFVNLLKPSSFSPVLAVVGCVMIMFTKDSRKKDIGSILMGFAVLMFGLETMSAAVKPLAQSPQFQQLFLMFQNPVLGVLAGAVLTGIIQSSSASVGILQALSLSGTITWAAAIPIIMGQNIGTCVTAILSGIGANKNARRVAMVHLYFNVIGAVAFLSLFSLARAAFGLTLFDGPINIAGIALAHSVFNISSTALMYPFLRGLEWLAYKTIPDTAEDQPRVLIDDRMLATPSFALSRCKELVEEMASISQGAVLKAMRCLSDYDREQIKQIQDAEAEVDRYEDALGSFLVKLSDLSLSTVEGREVSRILHGIGEFERISDHALNLSDTATEIHTKGIQFTAAASAEVAVLLAAVKQILADAVAAFSGLDVATAKRVEPLEQVIDGLTSELKLRHVERLRRGYCTVETGFVFGDLLTNCERIADHCSNLGVCVIELSQNSFNAHQYVRMAESMDEFAEMYDEATVKYALPPMRTGEVIQGQQSMKLEKV